MKIVKRDSTAKTRRYGRREQIVLMKSGHGIYIQNDLLRELGGVLIDVRGCDRSWGGCSPLDYIINSLTPPANQTMSDHRL